VTLMPERESDALPQDSEGKLVGPVIRGMDDELAEAIADAVTADNPDRQVYVLDCGGYIRIHTPWLCRLTRASLEQALGRSHPLAWIEPALSGFAGRMTVADDEITWYLERRT
jgi:toluene monooxygenase system protein D